MTAGAFAAKGTSAVERKLPEMVEMLWKQVLFFLMGIGETSSRQILFASPLSTRAKIC